MGKRRGGIWVDGFVRLLNPEFLFANIDLRRIFGIIPDRTVV